MKDNPMNEEVQPARVPRNDDKRPEQEKRAILESQRKESGGLSDDPGEAASIDQPFKKLRSR